VICVTPTGLVPQAGPAAWTGASLTPADWMLPVGAEQAAELAAAAQSGRRPERAEDAPLPQFAPLLQMVAERLEHGRGFVLLRGLSPEQLGPQGAEAALLVLAAHLGTALAQDETGTLIGSLAGPTAGAEEPARFHADPADVVALFCLRQPKEGGSVTLVSAPALHNALLKSDRAALAVLHSPLPHRAVRRGPLAAPLEPDTEAPCMLPVFSTASGAFVGRYDRQAMPDPLPEPAQVAALAALDAAAAAPGQALSIPLHAGDLLLYNPQLVWKRAAAGEARPAGEADRHLLRLWLATPLSRALPESFRAVFGETAAGARRGGVPTADRMVGG
ncbi:MAG: TauD/TfdA family dioxygenase, partial [Acetobacteraceae bacterium]|nr:TauD/TfdA family dioxygenase [Acetobacteraceae bacterium]